MNVNDMTDQDQAIIGRLINARSFKGRHFQLNYLAGHRRDVIVAARRRPK